jgi:hypothetical protein
MYSTQDDFGEVVGMETVVGFAFPRFSEGRSGDLIETEQPGVAFSVEQGTTRHVGRDPRDKVVDRSSGGKDQKAGMTTLPLSP